LRAKFSHIVLNVSDQSVSKDFYVSALAPLGFAQADEVPGEYTRISNGVDTIIVLSPAEERFRYLAYHRKAVGLGHFALCVESPCDIDLMGEHLATLGIALLGSGKTEIAYRGRYYCLLFEDPDRIMVEIAYHDEAYFAFKVL
jgi:catechol-2,3-dioxygenase